MRDERVCILCGKTAVEAHHIIAKGHIAGRCSEDWPLNLAPLCKDCHLAQHILGCHYEVLWNRMEYSTLELMVLAALGAHPKATMYPLVGKRAKWARGKLDDEARHDLELLLPQMEKQGAEAFRAFARLTDSRPVPGWI